MPKIKAYEGTEPYIFISYAHRNTDIVMPIIERLIADGYRVWYDEGIDPGTEWDEFIANKVIGCHCMIAMISDKYMESDNCRDELNFARDEDKPRLLVYLNNVTLPVGMRMRLNRLQAIHKYTYEDEAGFYDKLYDTDMLEECKGNSGNKFDYIKPNNVSKTEICDSVTYEGTKVVGCDTEVKHITVKEGTTVIEKSAFEGCFKLESVIIPKSVTSIDSGAFEACLSLEILLVEEGNTVYHSSGNCIIETASKTLIAGCKNSIIFGFEGVTSIGDCAFAGCGLTTLTIPNSVTKIGADAFFACSHLQSITIPKSLFMIYDHAFAGCSSLMSITIPKTVICIGNMAFSSCYELAKIHFLGTKAEWNSITKAPDWDLDTPSYTIHCTDGDIQK